MSERKRKEGREGRSSGYNAASAEAITSLHHTTVVVTDYHRVTDWALLATMSCAKHAPHNPVLAKVLTSYVRCHSMSGITCPLLRNILLREN